MSCIEAHPTQQPEAAPSTSRHPQDPVAVLKTSEGATHTLMSFTDTASSDAKKNTHGESFHFKSSFWFWSQGHNCSLAKNTIERRQQKLDCARRLLSCTVHAQWRTHSNDSFGSLVNHRYQCIQQSIAIRIFATVSLVPPALAPLTIQHNCMSANIIDSIK